MLIMHIFMHIFMHRPQLAPSVSSPDEIYKASAISCYADRCTTVARPSFRASIPI